VHHLIRDLVTAERVENQFRVTPAVFHQENAFQRSHGGLCSGFSGFTQTVIAPA
jgi:hypothetical protein